MNATVENRGRWLDYLVRCDCGGFPQSLFVHARLGSNDTFQIPRLDRPRAGQSHNGTRRDLRTGSTPRQSQWRQTRHISAPRYRRYRRYRTATASLLGSRARPVPRGPAAHVLLAARLRESLPRGRRWRSGSAGPSDPARGCRDRLAGLAAERAASCGVNISTCVPSVTSAKQTRCKRKLKTAGNQASRVQYSLNSIGAGCALRRSSVTDSDS
jgi:hypothetical protein